MCLCARMKTNRKVSTALSTSMSGNRSVPIFPSESAWQPLPGWLPSPLKDSRASVSGPGDERSREHESLSLSQNCVGIANYPSGSPRASQVPPDSPPNYQGGRLASSVPDSRNEWLD